MTGPFDTGGTVGQGSMDERAAALLAQFRAALKAKISEHRAAALQAMPRGVAVEGQTAADGEATSQSMDELLDQLIQDVVLPALPQTSDDVAAMAQDLGTSEEEVMALLRSSEFMTEVIDEAILNLLGFEESGE